MVEKQAIEQKLFTADLTEFGKPVFKFKGSWTGKDVFQVQKHMVREYKVFVRETQRKNAKTLTKGDSNERATS